MFFGIEILNYSQRLFLSPQNESPQRYLSNKISCTPNEDCMPKLCPEKLIHQTTQNGVHKTVGFSYSGVRVLDFLYDKKAFGASF
jgi:hypothetical protein